MDRTQFSLIVDIFGLIASFMTIIGVGGFVSWSIFKGGKDRLSSTILNIFAYSLKTGLCVLVGMLILLLGGPIAEIIQIFLIEPSVSALVSYDYQTSSYEQAVAYPSMWIARVHVP